MIVTLYKDCVFTKDYSEVCSTWDIGDDEGNARDKYLSSLRSKEYTIEDIYLQYNGVISVPFSIYSFGNIIDTVNYLKIKKGSSSTFQFFAFVDKVVIKNQLAFIYYSVDYWHTFFSVDNLRRGILCNSMQLDYTSDFGGAGSSVNITRYLPPVKLEPKEIEYKQLIPTNGKFYILAQVQKYKGTRSGDTSYRTVTTVMLSRWKYSTSEAYEYAFDYETAMTLISFYVQSMAEELTWHRGEYTEATGYYNIDNITLIPQIYDPDEKLVPFVLHDTPSETETKVNFFGYFLSDNEDLGYNTGFIQIEPFSSYKNYGLLTSVEIQNDFNTIGIGTLSSNFELVQCGQSYTAYIYYYYDEIDFKLLLLCQNKFLDITDSFVIDFPINSITGEANAQRKMARTMSTINNAIKIGEGVAQVVADIYTFGGATGANAITSGTGQVLSDNTSVVPYRQGFANWQSQYAPTADFGYTVQDVTQNRTYVGYNGSKQNAITGVGKIANGITGIIEANAPLFTSSTAIRSDGLNTISSRIGVFLIKIKTAFNTAYFNSAINVNGYRVQEVIEDNNHMQSVFNAFTDLSPSDLSYDILKFLYVDYIDNSERADVIKKILCNGVRIWYDGTAVG